MIQIGEKQATIEDPLEHLVACHRRIEQRLTTLERAAEALDTRPAEALEAVQSALRFMDTSGHLHTVDEEESVFPRLRPQLAAEEAAFLDSLENDHIAADAVYSELKQAVADLAAGVTADRVARFRDCAARLAAAYRAHIASEDTMLVAIGRRTLNPDQLTAIQQEMRKRRV